MSILWAVAQHPSQTSLPETVSKLRATGHERESVKQEMRRNLLQRLRDRKPLFPGIVGYDDTVLPQVRTRSSPGTT